MNINTLKVGMAALALSGFVSTNADAATILVFGQQGTGATITATNLGLGVGTDITGTNILVDITAIENSGPISGAYFNFYALSASQAVVVDQDPGPGVLNSVAQNFAGTFTITSLVNGGGTNYLSGSFGGSFTFGLEGGTGLTMAAAQPPGTLGFTSDVITSLDTPRSMSLGFTNVNLPLAVIDDQPGAGTFNTIRAFNSSVAGNFSAQAAPGSSVPEPSTMLLLGVGLIGAARAARRRR